MRYNVYDVFLSQFSRHHISVTIAAIFNIVLLQEYKGTMWLAVSSSLHSK